MKNKFLTFIGVSGLEKIHYLRLFFSICFVIILISIGYSVFVKSYIKERGTFGDMFGGLNSIFSGFAFAGIIITIIMQRKELTLTRNELRDTRVEFQVNRVTNIIYKQLEKLEFQVGKIFFINPSERLRVGNQGYGYKFINTLYHLRLNPPIGNNEDRNSYEKLKGNVLFLNTLSHETNISNLNEVSQSVSNSCEILDSIIKNSLIPQQNKIEFKNIFFKNLDQDLLSMLLNLDAYFFSEENKKQEFHLLMNNINSISNFYKEEYKES